jgi:putative nucleotidyltransferase with HDIG domain
VSLSDDKAEARPADAAWKKKIVWGLVMVVVFLALLERLFPVAVPGGGIEVSAGNIAREDIVAPFDFEVLKPEDRLEEERNFAEATTAPVYVFDESVQVEQRRHLADLLDKIYAIRNGPESERQKMEMLGQLSIALSDTAREVLLDPEQAPVVEDQARRTLNLLHERGVFRARGNPVQSPDQTIMLIRDDQESIVRVRDFLRQEDVEEAVEGSLSSALTSEEQVAAAGELIFPFVRGNIIYDAQETQRRREDARAAVSMFEDRDFKKDEVILEQGERITEDHELIVRSIMHRRAELLNIQSGPVRFFPYLGRILMAVLLLGTLVLYLSVRRRDMLLSNRCQLLFLVLVTIVMAGAAGVLAIPGASEYLVPIAVLAMMASMLFDFEVAAVSTFVTVLLVAIYTSFGLPFVLVSVLAGLVAAHSVREVRHREDFYLSGIRVVAAYAGAIFVGDVWDADVTMNTLTECGWGGLNAILSMGIVVVMLPLFERGFRVTTNITLLELADMNKPLLRKMAMASPGTYHHSIVVGNLAEAAAKAINANGLLARVGSYYHDIGKLVAPGYFVENQQGLEPEDSKHTPLKPKVSSLVIRAHVKDGVELAEKEGLPEPLIDIIREHHGTGVMEYFYNKAVETSEDPDEVSKGDYSYPGPRPRSKESAIIALADTIEARVRSIGDSITPKRIEAEITEVIEKRWRDHQLDDAELTLSDLTKIREAFFRVLAGMYHQRIRYPDQEGAPEEVRHKDAGEGGREGGRPESRGDAKQGTDAAGRSGGENRKGKSSAADRNGSD